MVKKMKIMDKLIINKRIFLFLLTMSIIGVITGCIFLIIISKNNSIELNNEINSFINNINSLNYFESFKNIFSANVFYLLVIWLIGISIIGIPISLILFFIKSFSLGFTISSFLLNYKLKGILISLIYIIPCQIINIIITIYLLSFSLIISFKLLESMIKKKSFTFSFISNYKKVLIFSILIFLLSNLYEIFIMPYLFNILHLIK